MKTCSRCRESQKTSEFYTRKNGTLFTRCKSCLNELSKEYREKPGYGERLRLQKIKWRGGLQAKFRAYLSTHPCIMCGESDIVVLDLDHLNSATKTMNVSDMVRRTYTWERIEQEIAKCQVLCANCHRRKTAKQFKWHTSVQ